MNFRIHASALALLAGVAAFSTSAQQVTTPAILNQVGITQNLNTRVPADLAFRDETGKSVRLGDFFGKKPIVLSLVYFECPALCTEVLNGELRTMNAISLNLGKDFEAVTVSFEPKDTPAVAKAKRDVYIGQYGRPGAVDHWHFLTGDQQSIDALTNVVGFQYAYDASIRQYAHAAAVVVLTPDGRPAVGATVVAAYLYWAGSSVTFSPTVPVSSWAPVSTSLSWTDLVALPEVYATAWAGLHQNLGLQPGQTVLVRGATSALGQAAVNIAAEDGVTVIATTRSAGRSDLLRGIGAASVLIDDGALAAGQ
jgi:cytochrome oxidase Cu insertion factor (SCO1/SenC/PrrC family)